MSVNNVVMETDTGSKTTNVSRDDDTASLATNVGHSTHPASLFHLSRSGAVTLTNSGLHFKSKYFHISNSNYMIPTFKFK
jgi:hypothetical protein